MKKDGVKNLPASIRQKLLNFSKENKEDFQLTLTRYIIERLLFRLSISEYNKEFILKGALMFLVWENESYRPTRDLDLLGFGTSSIGRLVEIFKSLCQMKQNDGLIFDSESVSGEEIRGQQEYPGIRINLLATLEQASITLQIDIGFGDIIVPGPKRAEFPTILDMPAPSLRTYSKETVVAEKYEAIVRLGMGNSRMKDFYDIWILQETSRFNGATLAKAIQSTFKRRNTDLPLNEPIALTEDFAEDEIKQAQWKAFIKRSRLSGSLADLKKTVKCIRNFLFSPTQNLIDGSIFNSEWGPGGPWKEKNEN